MDEIPEVKFHACNYINLLGTINKTEIPWERNKRGEPEEYEKLVILPQDRAVFHSQTETQFKMIFGEVVLKITRWGEGTHQKSLYFVKTKNSKFLYVDKTEEFWFSAERDIPFKYTRF